MMSGRHSTPTRSGPGNNRHELEGGQLLLDHGSGPVFTYRNNDRASFT